ncbi:MAG: NlpC/P60 family protein [Leptospirales bacterium]
MILIKRILLYIVLSVTITLPLFAVEFEEKLHEMVTKACSAEQGPAQESRLAALIERIHDPEHWDNAVNAIIHRACFLEYRNWLTGHSFNLAYYGASKGLKQETIESLTDLMSIQTFGKDDYYLLGLTFERMAKAGVSRSDLIKFMQKSIHKRYQMEAIEGLAIFYVKLRGAGENHKDAYSKANKNMQALRSSRNSNSILAMAIRNTTLKEIEETEEVVNWEVEKEKFWKKAKARKSSVRYSIKGKSWDEKKLVQFFESWKGTRFLYGGSSKKGIDSTGFVIKAIKNHAPGLELPGYAAELSKLGSKKNVKSLKPGDLVFFSASLKKGNITDVGIYLGNGQFAHSTAERGVTLSNLTDKYYTTRFVMGKRLF